MMKREEGFTLIEVIVSMTILAAGIIAVFGLLSGSLRLSSVSRDSLEASIYAGQRIEEAFLAPNPVEGEERGSFGDKYRWELSTSFVGQETEAEEEGETEKREEAYEGIRMTVRIVWTDGGDERSTEVSAIRWRLLKKDENV
ncbi:MAG: prepilin-type N-terminal cleavage/methylation domain-containing protein [Syntrophorhabdaceae bacterium]|nr:prepilin-type N-terminal cleavage/methylation domain-containing protein [Syntrophorhabdaceae bacterium]